MPALQSERLSLLESTLRMLVRYPGLTSHSSMLCRITLPPPINATQTSLTGGLFDPSGSCGTINARNDILGAPTYQVRLADVYTPPCSSSPPSPTGDGLLFTVQFKVLGTNSTSLDVATTGPNPGDLQELLTTAAPNPHPVPGIQVSDLVFQNLAGALPTPQFTFSPSLPFIGETVDFNGSLSFVTGSETQPDRGIKRMIWSFGDAGANIAGTMANASQVSHVFLISATILAAGYYPVRLIVFGSNPSLPNRQEQVVYVNPGTIDDVAVSVQVDKTTPHLGESVGVKVTVANAGNQVEQVSMNVTYQFQGTKILGQEPNITLAISQRRPFNYTLDTTNLIPEAFTLTAQVAILGTNKTDAHPGNNIFSQGITVLPPPPGTETSILLYIGIGIAVIAAAVVAITLVRRRGREKDTIAE
jgi:hypothetical protein